MFPCQGQGSCLRRIGVCFLFFGIITGAIAQGNSDRKWSVRKTGEFGRRIDHLSEALARELELPTKQFRLHEPTLDTAESRGYGFMNAAPVRRPSQNLELPNFLPSSQQDQVALASGDAEGYEYSPPDDDQYQEGYDYTPPSPVGKLPAEEPEATLPPKNLPDPNVPQVVPGSGDAFILATDEQIDADRLNAQKRLQQPSPQNPGVKQGDCTDDNDPNCWTHGYEGIIPGKAGEDYPILSEIVPTDFSCDEQQFSGYYADADERARCQIFHICLKRNRFRKTQQWSFLCPNGTVFSQDDFVCVWWGNAPECNGATVRSLYSLNERLGWDNITEAAAEGRKASSSNIELQSAMSAFNPAVPTTYRPSSAFVKGPLPSTTKTAHPYRVPVKVKSESGRPRTKLQEVTQNALHGSVHELDYGDDTEHEVEESSNFETSLRQQSESRHRSKTGSSLQKSESEGYELKGSPDGVQPFVVNRPGGGQDPNTEIPQFSYDDGENESIPQVVMMPTRQRYPDGSEGYAEVPVMLPHGTTDEPAEGYSYPKPTTSTPAPSYLPPREKQRQTTPQPPTTTTEYFPPPTIPTEPPLDNYESDYQTTQSPIPTTSRSNGYRYSNPTTTEESGYRYTKPTTLPTEGYENKYYQEQQVKTTTEQSQGYRYPEPTDSDESGYSYPRPSLPGQSERQENDRYAPQEATTEQEGYSYRRPTTRRQPQSLRNTNPTTTTEQPATTEEALDGYNYPVPEKNEQLQDVTMGYDYPSPATTEQSSATTAPPNDQYQVTVTDNEVTDEYQFESTRTPDVTKSSDHTDYDHAEENYSGTTASNDPQGYQDVTENSSVSMNPTTTSSNDEEPAGAYLPPKDDTPSETEEPPAGSYLPPAETDTQTEEPPGGYLPPKNQDSLPGKQEGEQIDEDTQGIAASPDYEDEENELVTNPTGPAEGSEDGYSYNLPNPPTSSNNPPVVVNGGPLDSDEKINEILKQIQNGGIEAVDSSGKPIEFSKLKELLLSSPRGSVELKGEVDSLTSSSTEIPKSPQTQQQPRNEQQPFYHTVTTAQIMPNNDNNVLFNNNQNQAPSPSDFYLPPQSSYNNNNQPQSSPQFNTNNAQLDQPSFDIKLPNREFETHSVEVNKIDTNNNPNHNNFIVNNQPQQANQFPQNSQSGFFPQQPQQQQQYFPSQNTQTNPTLATSLVIPPSGSYLPPTTQAQGAQEHPQPPVNVPLLSSYTGQDEPYQQRPSSSPTSGGQQINGEYLPPRQGSASILQSQYYNAESASQQSPNSFLSQPIQLTENIQLQQSFAQPFPTKSNDFIGTNNGNGNNNPLLDPKNIKIVPALFVHEHTSVAADQTRNSLSNVQQNVDYGFQTLETAQTVYEPSRSLVSDFENKASLTQQLNQLANSVYVPPRNNVGRQFFRRSNANIANAGESSVSAGEPSHTIQKATRVTSFTLEDARTPEELQKYHHEDLKRFHSENIAKQGSILDDVLPPPRTTETTSTPFEHRSGLLPQHQSNKDFNVENTDNNKNGGSRHTSSGGSTSSRFSINSSNLSKSRGGSNNEEYFIPISGSYREGGSGRTSSSSSNNSNHDKSRVSGSDSRSNSESSQFRISGRGGSRSHDSESERSLLRRFRPEEEGGFGSRILY